MTICIGISFYNAENYLGYAVSSIVNQSYTNWKLILVDDGSTDQSLEVARKFAIDKRITVLYDGVNRGLIYRLNQLVALCDTEYYVRMDADDIMHPERLQKQVAFLCNNPQIDVLGSWAYSIDVNNKIQGVLKTKTVPNSVLDVFSHCCFIHPSIMGRTAWFNGNRYSSDFQRMEDLELWTRTILESSFSNLPEPLLFYREVGVPYLHKYLCSMHGERKLIRLIYSNSSSGLRYNLLLRSYLKSAIYTVFSIFHLQDFLIRKRSCKINSALYCSAIYSLNKAINGDERK